MLSICWLDLAREAMLKMNEHVLQWDREKVKEPGCAEFEGGSIIRTSSHVGCGLVCRKIRVDWGT